MKKAAVIIILASQIFFGIGSNYALAQADRLDNPFGVLAFFAWQHDWNGYHYDRPKLEQAADLLKELGVAIVRVDFLWSDIEPSPGIFKFQKYDEIVNILANRNIAVLAILDYNPSWINNAWNSRPDFKLYINYAKTVVRHFKGKVKYWEIWNEPDSPAYWQPQDYLLSYVKLLKQVYPAIKKEDPSCYVLNGGVANPFSVKLLYKYGAKDYFDILNVHIFADPYSSEFPSYIRSVYKGIVKTMDKYGDFNKKIWVTEIGCPGRDNTFKRWWMGKSPTQYRQALFLKKAINNLVSQKRIQQVFWAFFRDTDNHFKSGVDYFGLVTLDFGKKRAFSVYKNLIKQWKRKH